MADGEGRPVNIQPGWEGFVYGVLIAAGVAFVLATIAVAFGLRAVGRIIRPTTTLSIAACIPIAACLVGMAVGGYIAVKHLQHPTGHPQPLTTSPSTVGGPPTHPVTVRAPVVAVGTAPSGDIVVTVRVPSCGFNASLGTIFSSTETLDIGVSPSVEVPKGIDDPLVACESRTEDLSIGRMPSRPGMTLTDGQQIFTLGDDGTWTPSRG